MSLSERYAEHLDQVDEAIRAELAEWPWDTVGRLGELVAGQLAMPGDRLRPITALYFAEFYGARYYRSGLDRVVAPAASVEFCHRASLVLDNLHGISAVHTAAAIRSLAAHPIHRSPLLDAHEKLALHQEFDQATTWLEFGRSIEDGWHEQWYPSYLDFPYERMLSWKAGSLFGCAAAIGAVIAGAADSTLDEARARGVAIGALHQLADDYLDGFGGGGAPASNEDFRAGKLSGPVVFLLRALHAAGRERAADSVLRRLADGDAAQGDIGWLLALMRTCSVEETMRRELVARAAVLAGDGLEEMVSLVLAGISL